jgi:hypothetical protein
VETRELSHGRHPGADCGAEAILGGREIGIGGLPGGNARGVQRHAVDPLLDVGLSAEGE